MTDLVEFLLARIGDDEETARRCIDGRPTGRWIVTRDKSQDGQGDRPVFVQLRRSDAEEIAAIAPGWGESYDTGDRVLLKLPWAEDDPRDLLHAARWDPARVLAQCQAQRSIIAWVTDETVICEVTGPVLAALALPYATHPDYREEWRPFTLPGDPPESGC